MGYMPIIPLPTGAPPELMPWIRWAQGTIEKIDAESARQQNSDKNINASQNSTMAMLVEKLGTVQGMMSSIVATAAFSAGQITSGVLAAARIPGIDAGKIVSGAFSVDRIPAIAENRISGGINGSKLYGDANMGSIALAGNLYVPNSSTATSSWVAAYINGDGRLTKGASSRRFKKNIVDAPANENYFQAPMREWEMRQGDGSRIIGYIAEELIGTDSERFVVWDTLPEDHIGPQVPVSIDFTSMFQAQISQLHRELEDTRARLKALEEN